MLTATVARLVVLGVLVSFGLALGISAPAADDKLEKLRVFYIGTYTGKNSKGIYLGELDLASGGLTTKGVAAETVNPS